MAQLTKSAFLSKYLSIFADNSTREISEQDMRDFREDIADSFINISDASPLTWGGLWDWPADAFPNPALGGTLYIADGDHGEPGDDDYVQSGTWFISKDSGATVYSNFSYKL